MPHRAERLTRRVEWPWVVGLLTLVLGGWWALNRFVLCVYPTDATEGGRFTVLRWGTDPNPARAEQINIFNRAYRNQGLKVEVTPDGARSEAVITRSAAQDAPDVIDAYSADGLQPLIAKGIAIPLNPYLKEAGLSPAALTWPAVVDNLSVANPAYRPGSDDPLDERTWYAVPNNLYYSMTFFNRSLYQQVVAERRAEGQGVPPEPWLGWTWWDYAALAAVMQRRGPDGRFRSFGGSPPEVEEVALMIGAAQRGEDRSAFERLTETEKAAHGVAGLSWEDCVTAARRSEKGRPVIWPNRTALREALQFCHDLQHVLHAVPTASEQAQMATGAGGYGAQGLAGQFLAGNNGMLIIGRWYLGQVHAHAGFDWRLVRLPRWVPYTEWERWQRAGLAPGERDGAWGDREHPHRGYLLAAGTRATFISSSAKNPRQAFQFLRCLLTDPDYNRLILLEDGAGADRALALSYFAAPDPLVPAEVVNRAPEQELGAVHALAPQARWPWITSGAKGELMSGSLGAWLSRPSEEGPAAADGAARLTAFGPFVATISTSSGQAGEQLAQRLVPRLTDLAEEGRQREVLPHPIGPSWPTTAVMGGLLSLLVVLGWNAHRQRRTADPLHASGVVHD